VTGRTTPEIDRAPSVARQSSRVFRIGVVSSEFAEPTLGGTGGFGVAAQRVAKVLHGAGDPRIEVLLISLPTRHPEGATMCEIGGAPAWFRSESRWRDARRLRREHLDLLITIDWRPAFLEVAYALPRTPMIVWIRDPRPRGLRERIATLRVPPTGDAPYEDYVGGETAPRNALARLVRVSHAFGRPLSFPATAPFLFGRFEDLVGRSIRKRRVLGTPLAVVDDGPRVSPATVLMLGRLDPIKRPWIVWELARAVPDVQFVVAGSQYEAGWAVPDASRSPSNLRQLGYVDGTRKHYVLRDAGVLLNTSIHEGLPVSFCEALHHSAALVSTIDAGEVTARFGFFVPDSGGTGLSSVDRLAGAVRRLTRDDSLRSSLGSSGRHWVRSVHSTPAFLRALLTILDDFRSAKGLLAVGSLLD
jgi:glycosyltransferase involved in cell wall biosynthesis